MRATWAASAYGRHVCLEAPYYCSRLYVGMRAAGALERRREGDRQLRDHVEAEARDLAGEAFTRFMAELYKRIYHLIARQAPAGAPARAQAAAHMCPALHVYKGTASFLTCFSESCMCHLLVMNLNAKSVQSQVTYVQCSPDQNERLGGVLAIDELIDVKVRATRLPSPVTTLKFRSSGAPACFSTEWHVSRGH